MKWEEFLEQNPHVIRLDDNHVYKWTCGDPGRFEDVGLPRMQWGDQEDMVRTGIVENHRTADGMTCGGYVGVARPLNPSEFEANAPIWKVESFEPLTLSPSVQCPRCGSHGFIQEGRWVNAQ